MKHYIFDREKDNYILDEDGEKICFTSNEKVYEYLNKICELNDGFISENFYSVKHVKILPVDYENILSSVSPLNESSTSVEEMKEAIAGILYKNKSDEGDEGCWINSEDFYKVAEIIAKQFTFLPAGSVTGESEENLWYEVKEVFFNHYDSYNSPQQAIAELLSTYKLSNK